MRAYVGSFEERLDHPSLHVFDVDPGDGSMVAVQHVAGPSNPSFLASGGSGSVLHAVGTDQMFDGRPGGWVGSLRVDATTGLIEPPSSLLVPVQGPCYLSEDPAGDVVYTASYHGGGVCAYWLDDEGCVESLTDIVRRGGAASSSRPRSHAHCVLPDPQGEFIIATDLGTDHVLTYRMDRSAGALVQVAECDVPTGNGPRHLVFHPNGRRLYASDELSATVSGYSYSEGRVRHLLTVPVASDSFSGPNRLSDLRLHPDGRFLCVANRGPDTVVVLRVDEDAESLEWAGEFGCGGVAPRWLSFSPDGRLLFVANQRSDQISVFAIDGQSGALEPTGAATSVPSPACIVFR